MILLNDFPVKYVCKDICKYYNINYPDEKITIEEIEEYMIDNFDEDEYDSEDMDLIIESIRSYAVIVDDKDEDDEFQEYEEYYD